MATQTSPLDSIVRRLDPNDIILPNEQLIIWEANAGVTLTKEPSPLVRFMKKVVYFGFSNAEVDCTKIVFRIIPGVSFDIQYKASCPRGNEGQVIAGLYRPNESFELVLQNKIQAWLKEFVDQTNLQTILNSPQIVREFLQEKIWNETGLAIIADVRLQNAEYLQPYSIKGRAFPVRVKDYARSINLTFSTELVLLPGSESVALQRHSSLAEQPQKLQTIIEKCLYESVGLNTLYDELSNTVKPLLIKEINGLLRAEGRQILFLDLTMNEIVSQAERRIDVECVGDYKIADYSEQIKVTSTVAMKLYDLATFKTAENKYGITNVQDWFRNNVVNVQVKDYLFEKTYEEILVNTDEIKSAIEQKVREQAQAIGYTVMQHVFLPDINKLDLLKKGFEIVLTDAKFLSSDSRVSVTLSIKIYGNITNLRKLQGTRLLLPNVKIEHEMQSDVVKAVEEVLHKIEPERFFMRFKGDFEDEAVDKVLIDKMTAVLTEKYAVDRSSLRFIVSPMENEVSQKVAALTEEIQDIKVTVSPTLDSPYTEKLDFILLFRILGVLRTGWYSFQMNLKKEAATEIEEIKKVLEVAVHENLVACRYQELMSQEFRFKKVIKETILKKVFDNISEKFGLFIEFIDCKRSSTVTETEANISLQNKVQKEEENSRLLLEKQHASHNKIVDELSEKRDELLRNSLFDEAVEVENQIKKVQEIYKDNLENYGMDIRKQSSTKLSENKTNLSLFDGIGAQKQIENSGNN